MQNILTKNEILEYSKRGLKQILLAEMPLMTDLAQEEMERLGMEIVVTGEEETSKTQTAAAPRIEGRPAGSGGYGGAAVYAGTGQKPLFKEVICSPKKLVGTFVGTPHPVMTEYVGHLGFDFVCIDSEHNAMHLETVQKMLQSLRHTPAYGMVRVPTLTYECVTGALDIGADALLIPQIRTADDVLRLRSFSLYPPKGRRGVGPSRLWDYGDSLSDSGDMNRRTNIVIQLETVAAVENIDDILKAADDFVDMFFVGPGDLSMDMGIFGQFTNPKLVDTILYLREKTRALRKRLGVFAGNFQAAQSWFEKGFDMALVNSELAILGAAVSREMPALRAAIEEQS
ncbi:MAG: hypothetical protein HFI67_00680 [Lachnospiraceae bacterium]|jgi:4-hydroxy-2-oxoheptanedioate aldolase|nr:hypothetical protein [Lachnospiraceae bacterium]